MFSYMVRYTLASLLSVLLRRHWGMLFVDSQENETHPIASTSQDSDIERVISAWNSFIFFISISLMLWKERARGMITYIQKIHWMPPLYPPPPKMAQRFKSRNTPAREVWEMFREELWPLPRPRATTMWNWWTVTASPPSCNERTKVVRAGHCPRWLKVRHSLERPSCCMSPCPASETSRLWEWMILRHIQEVLSSWMGAVVIVTITNNNSLRNTSLQSWSAFI